MIPQRNREILIEKLAQGMSIPLACFEAQISKASLYRIMKKEPMLKAKFEAAVFEGKKKKK